MATRGSAPSIRPVRAAGQRFFTALGTRAVADPIEPGLHIVTENAAEDRGPRGELVRAHFPLDLDPARLRAVLALHGSEREGTCIHLEPRYGTRSSVILRRAASLGAIREVGIIVAASGST